MSDTTDNSSGTCNALPPTVRLISSNYHPHTQYPRTNMTQGSLDSNANDQESFLPRSDSKTLLKGTLRLGKNGQQPLTLGGFARTLLKQANTDSLPKDNEFALSPNSVKKLMFFPTPAEQKVKSEIPNLAFETSKENLSPPSFSSLCEVKETTLTNKPEEVEDRNKPMCLKAEDSGISHSLYSMTEALDVSVGSASTNKRVSRLHSIHETNESPNLRKKNLPLDRIDSAKKVTTLKPSRSEGCININVVKDSSMPYKPSPPLRQEGQLQPSAPLKCALLIPTNPMADVSSKSRKSTSELGSEGQGKGSVKVKRNDKFSSLRGTPKGFDPSKLRDPGDVEQRGTPRLKIRGKIDTKPKEDWNAEFEVVQGKKYMVIDQLGKGASGVVSLVVEVQSKCRFALKKVNLAGINESVIQECINEIQMLVELKDTDLVIRIQAWEINKIQQTMKIVMEYGQEDLGMSLKSTRYSLQEVRAFWERMLKIVSKIHERGIVHSDLKPANFVFVGARLKIIDFGIASRLQTDHTSISMINPKGTLNYISPETIRPDAMGRMKIGPKSDIWSLGCILYLMVYGKTPFQDHTHYISKITAIANGNIIYPPLPPAFEGSGVDSVLRMCFMMDHRQRPSATELLQHHFLPGPTIESSNIFKMPFYKT